MFRCFVGLVAAGVLTTMSVANDNQKALDFQVKNIDGEPVDLKDYQGKVVLIVPPAAAV